MFYMVYGLKHCKISFVGVTIYFLENSKLTSGSLKVFELFEKRTDDYLKKKLTEIFQDWNISIDKVTAIVTDNDSTDIKANRDMFSKKNCFAYTGNLVVMHSLDKLHLPS